MKTSYLPNDLEIQKNDFEFIRGKFSPQDALEILGDLIQQKINYHQLKSFSDHERIGAIDQRSESRIKELRESLESIQVLIARAEEQGGYLDITSTISINVIPS